MAEYNYKVDTIDDGSPDNETNGFFTYVVDPNPTNNVSISNEDLFIFVRLRSFPRNRSVITSDNVFNSIDQNEDAIYFIASNNQNGKGYLTTSYSNIGETEGTIEGLGIKNITINVQMMTPPTVEINFVDVKGAAVFNNYEQYDGTNYYNTSKFNSFFRLPYPIFELTVKGFCGKASTYYLNLYTFNASVDTSSGDFLIKTTFIGYQFAFLSDILTQYVVGLNNSPIGQQYLKDYVKKDKTKGLLSIPRLLEKYTEIATYTDNFKKEENDYELLKILNSLSDKINVIYGIFGLPATKMQKQYGSLIIYDNLNYGYIFLRDIGLFSSNLQGNLDEFEKNLNIQIDQYNEIIAKYESKHPSLSDFKLKNFSLEKIKNYDEITDALLDDIQAQITIYENQNFRVLYDKTEINNKLGSLSPFFTISFYDIRKNVFETYEKIKNERLKYEEEIINKLNKAFIENIGFNPTVFNVFEIIMGNVDIFLDIVYETCKKADSLGEDRVQLLQNYFENQNAGSIDVPFTANKIFPFPAVYNLNGEQIWLGDVVGENNPNYPELNLVNELIKGLVSDELPQNEQENQKKYSNNNDYKWISINPLDYDFNNFDNANNFDYSDEQFSDLFENMLGRLLAMYKHSGFSDSKILKFAEIESSYFISKITTNNIKILLQNIDTNVFVERATNYYTSNTDLKSIVGTNLTFNLDENNFDIFIDDNPINRKSFENKILEPNINKSLTRRTYTVENLIEQDLPLFTYKSESNTYAITTDLSLCFNNNSMVKYLTNEYINLYGSIKKAEIPLLSLLKNIKVLDGDLSGIIDNGNSQNNFYKNNAHLSIGKSITNYGAGEPLFDLFYYSENDSRAKAFLFLQSIGFQNYTFFKTNLISSASIAYIPELYLCYLGGLIQYSFNNTQNLLTDNIKNHPDFNLISDLFGYNSQFMNQADFNAIVNAEGKSLYNFLTNLFEEFVNEYSTTFEIICKNYVYLGLNFNKTQDQEKEYQAACDAILNKIKNIKRVIISSPFKIFNIPKSIPDISLVTEYSKIFCNAFKPLIELKNENTPSNPVSPTNTLTVDANLKIAIYNHLKNIYDKWLSYNTTDGKIYNFSNYIRGVNTKKRLIDHCYFIDRTWSDIGEVAVLNPKPLLIYSNELDQNIYFFISRILKDNKFLIYSIPNYVNYYDKQDVANMFKPYDYIDNSEGGACFIFQYVAGNSKVLDLNDRVGFVNDGFDFKSDARILIPERLIKRKAPSFITQSDLNAEDLKDYLQKYNLSVFRVAYADQNQNIFTKIEVGQEDHRETGESILIKSQIAGGKGETKRLFTGADLYNYYAVRSYKAEIECLGNTQIIPSQYFQLDNIPLFHGAHIITSVKHYIEPHNMTTSFSGRRISRFTYPIIDKITTHLNLELNERISEETKTTQYEETGEFINGIDNFNPSDNEVAKFVDIFTLNKVKEANRETVISPFVVIEPTDNVLFTIVENEFSAKFILSSNVTFSELQNRLNVTLPQNNVPTFGLGENECASWVRNVFLRLGVVKIGNANTDAWNWFMGLPEDRNMYYFSSEEKLSGWTFADYKNKGVKNGSLIFGYTETSRFKDRAYERMTNNYTNKQLRLNFLRNEKRISDPYKFSIVTHVGIFYNGMMYDLIKGKVSLSAQNSFIPIAHYHFLPTLEKLARKNG